MSHACRIVPLEASRLDRRTAAARAPRGARARPIAVGVAAREDEAQIAGAFRQRHEQLVGLGGDRDVVDAGDRRASSTPDTPRYTPRAGIGIIMTPEAQVRATSRRAIRRARDAAAAPRASIGVRTASDRPSSGRCPTRWVNRKRPGAQTADRPRRDFERRTRRRSLTRHSA